MGLLLHLVSLFACLQAILSTPIQGDLRPFYDDYRLTLAKKDSFYPFKESFLSTLGLFENSREGSQNQRKKAVDSTFIRFGRSSSSEANHSPNPAKDDTRDSASASTNAVARTASTQRLLLNHNGCRIENSQELVRALMNDRSCIRAIQKAKRESVNDTFIRFGKRSVPSQEESRSRNSEGW